MVTNAAELQKYFADMDAAEEADAAAAGMTPDELRESRLEPETEKAARREARFAQDLNERNAININAKNVKDLGLFDIGETTIPTSMQRPKTQASPVSRAAEGFEERAGRQLRYPIDTVDLDPVPSLSMPSSTKATTDFASLQRLMSPGALKAPEAAPIPTKAASVRADAPAAVASALPPTTDKQPAGTPDSAGTPGLPAPSSTPPGSGGDDEERNLYLARLIARNAASFGAMGAGKNIDTGAVEALGERLKQVQALQAKKTEKAEAEAKAAGFASKFSKMFPGFTPEQQATLGQLGAEGGIEAVINAAKMFKGAQVDEEVQRQVNEAALASAVARYPELATSFEALRPVAGKYPQKDFAAMLDKAAAGQAGFAAKGATTRFMVDKQGRFNQLTPGEVEKQQLENARLRQQIDLDSKVFSAKEQQALSQTYKDDDEKAIKLNELAEKEKGFGGYVTLANDLAELEASAPGFVTRGKAPAWLTTAQQTLGQNWPTSSDPRVVKFLAAYGKLSNAERHRLYGSAQTEGELKAFLQQLNDNPFSAGPGVLAQQMGGFAGNVARRATNTLNRYSSVFGANTVDRVLGNEFRPLYEKGGVFAALKTPFQAAPAAPAAGGRPQKPADKSGTRTLWNKKTGQWVRYTPEQEAKARAAGAIED